MIGFGSCSWANGIRRRIELLWLPLLELQLEWLVDKERAKQECIVGGFVVSSKDPRIVLGTHCTPSPLFFTIQGHLPDPASGRHCKEP